ncbi:Nicotinate-nucleotide--dimethylbenzimidazole phosphoribosyltransferase [Syntrophobotulus glycolicus DSM 8271]|uniref:Nicotinate-nucleotide--dimethylbenzimidazole phosphoribosyltransferase n=1 Tax=Syntrophobotulus glycolicus (strain DSM 8271 / FlGlyR) TaxID=645991 RepID=F0SZ54_SYNGF|nr:nicotinate-nucleotide--dimethylbenzimidazole phosphoribosyltransferase [Syntrophobotulus glycolicus]ADY57172.1 Nicotinate-nucleotide--dimethylbenzimidazole phosphoribosyltransferase [Syntrophobotulus glycolicus DSM 8271]
MSLLNEILSGINPVSPEAVLQTQKHLDNLIKPLGSLGKLEEIAVRISAITGKRPNSLEKKCVLVFAADNGICAEGVSAAPAAITALQTINMTKRIAGINVLSRQAGADVYVVDIGVDADLPQDGMIIDRKIRRGTRNMLLEPAMTREETIRAVETGIEMVKDLVDQGYQVIGTGEMGIGNTSTSGAVIMSLIGLSAGEAVGKGAGMTEIDFEHKKAVLHAVLDKRQPDSGDPLDVLSKVGGYDIAGIAGVFLGCAYYRLPVVIDGLISITGALIASRLNPLSVQYMLPSHLSAEPGYRAVMAELGISPYFDLDMRLGEGTGCPLTFYLIDCALAVGREMGTFEQGEIDGSVLVDIR